MRHSEMKNTLSVMKISLDEAASRLNTSVGGKEVNWKTQK